ncbi:MAG TPA: carboxylating nicotinate-nucleotide diphosphorylase [Candidatus Acidoferrales bacterium]|jgi:nicotinate-nucleotide pyrophosphorylase (carboxylating)|nr:carboxylating nicotinate-nucleotide diphosphorylase [Candidatus Acidoferrales bacterium]
MSLSREQRTERALFRGAGLTLDGPEYRGVVRAFTESLVRADLAPRDLTIAALGIRGSHAEAGVLAREGGVVAGLAELAFLLQSHGIVVAFEKNDGDAIRPADLLLRAEGTDMQLLALERVGLNLVQRMSGIATASRCLQQHAHRQCPATRIVGTRKTPWGLLDKRALHLGNGGTHRLGLGDAIVIKNNHLAVLAPREEDAAPIAIEKAWALRKDSAFIEVEVRGEASARAAAAAFRRVQEDSAEEYDCLLMLDNMTPDQIGAILDALRRESLWEYVLIEASGGISESNVESYAARGVDAISIGALTHSARALDICQRIS